MQILERKHPTKPMISGIPERREHEYVRFHFTPKHGSWLNQVELFFGVLQRRFLARGEFKSAEEFEQRLTAYLEDYNARYAHPYRWTYTSQPLVRATPFERTRRQQQLGRAWVGRRPQLFEKLLYPPGPYRKASLTSWKLTK
jgi:hypothetical protein